jgi:hypothetical protein
MMAMKVRAMVEHMPDGRSTGDPIPEVFDPDRVDARFVVTMTIARNDIEVAVHEGMGAAAEGRPDFAYRVRLATSHLVEALDSLNAYSQEDDVKKLMARVPADGPEAARPGAQRASEGRVERARPGTEQHVPLSVAEDQL